MTRAFTGTKMPPFPSAFSLAHSPLLILTRITTLATVSNAD